jgi:L-ascorbate metabolism protein UlaG (beta-lactamase superfamily)
MRLLTDPLLRDRVLHIRRQGPVVEPSLYENIDTVLISHLHLDHVNVLSLKMIGLETTIVAPHGLAILLQKWGFQNIVEMEPGEIINLGAVKVEAIKAVHKGLNLPLLPDIGCLGYLIKGSQTVYFPGDTDVFPEMANLQGKLDVALLPVWGWGPNLGKGHMDPKRAAVALTLLRPRIAIPIHWGTFYPVWLEWFRPYLLIDPPHNFQQEAARIAPDIEINILKPGNSMIIPVD